MRLGNIKNQSEQNTAEERECLLSGGENHLSLALTQARLALRRRVLPGRLARSCLWRSLRLERRGGARVQLLHALL